MKQSAMGVMLAGFVLIFIGVVYRGLTCLGALVGIGLVVAAVVMSRRPS